MNRITVLARNPWARGLFVLALLGRRHGGHLVAWPRVEHRLPRVRRGDLALGDHRRPAQSPLRPRALAVVAADDRPGAARAAPPLRPGVLRLRDRAARERGAARPGRRVRARRGAAPAPPARPRNERDPARHRLRAPAVRPVPGRDPRHLGSDDREDPALGRDEPDHLRARRLRPPDDRPPVRPLRRRPRARRHGKPARAPDHGPPGPRRPAAAGAGARRGDVPARRLADAAASRSGR